MSEFGVTLIWCAGQVAAIGALAAVVHCLLRSYGRSLAPVISFTAVVVSICLAGTAIGPWPSYLDWFDMTALTESMRPSAETNVAPLAPSQDLPVTTVMLDMARTAILEMSPADSQSLIANWPWSRVLAMLFVMGLAVGLLQLSVGLTVVTLRLRRSHPLRDRRLVRMLEQLRRDMGCTRSVEIRVSYDLATAATVGWSDPVILLPCDWRTWSEQERRAVLAHEMAHIVHNDYLAVLLSQIGSALHFYHPMVHWLAAQMRLEQEFAADAVAAEHAGGRREYLTTLAAMALRQSSESQLLLARAFVPERGALLKRIKMLKDSKRPTRPLSTPKQAVLVVAILLAGLAVSGFRSPNEKQAWAGPLQETPSVYNMYFETDRSNESSNWQSSGVCPSLSNGSAKIDGCTANENCDMSRNRCRAEDSQPVRLKANRNVAKQ